VARCGVTVRSRHVEVPRRDREWRGAGPVPQRRADDNGDDNADDSPDRSTLRGRVASQIEGERACALLVVKGSPCIFSESSTETARRVRTDRSASARSRSSAAHNNASWYTDARPISVHTGVLAGISVPLRTSPDRPTLSRTSSRTRRADLSRLITSSDWNELAR
jgi:hypothetical protein